MPRGGARNRSGPQPDENSLKSAKIGYTLTALPSEGYDGETPDFPLPARALSSCLWRDSTGRAQSPRLGSRPSGKPCSASSPRCAFGGLNRQTQHVHEQGCDGHSTVAVGLLRMADCEVIRSTIDGKAE